MRIAIVAALALLLVLPAAASATFPGRDGRLAAVYSVENLVGCGTHSCETSRERLVTMSARGRDKRTLYRCNPCGLSRLAWSPTGRRVAWSDEGRIYVAPAAGGPQEPMQGVAGYDPAWRPDNAGLAFRREGKLATVDRSGFPVDIADGGAPSWCRNGTIAFVGYDAWLMRVQPDGSGLERVSRGAYAGPPDCSPDGRSVIFWTGRGIYVSRLRGRNVRRVRLPVDADEPVWSPSGRRIAWSDAHDIWISRSDGTHRRKVTRGAHFGDWVSPSWQPLP